MRVAVSGGGIGGLTFAALAARAGFEPVVLERALNMKKSSFGGGIALWPTSQAVMKAIGVLDILERQGAYMPAPSYTDRGGRPLARASPEFQRRFPVLCLQRDVLCAVLAEACHGHGVDIRTGSEVVGIDGGEGAPLALTLGDGITVEADLLVG